MNEEKINQKISLKTMFFANSGGYSSKRILGVTGFFVCCIIFILAFILNKPVPEFGEMLLITSASLAGLDSITGIWNKSINK